MSEKYEETSGKLENLQLYQNCRYMVGWTEPGRDCGLGQDRVGQGGAVQGRVRAGEN